MSNQKNLTTNDTWFFGHPKGMVTLFFTEMWERMSYYGMRALLVLYMTGAVTGFNPGLGWSQVDAQAIYGIYVGMVYFMVIPGGWLADNCLRASKSGPDWSYHHSPGPLYLSNATHGNLLPRANSSCAGNWAIKGEYLHNSRSAL